VPVKSLSISSSKTEISSSSTTGEIATLSHSLNFGCVSLPTNTSVEYYVRESSFIDNSSLSNLRLISNTIKVKAGTPSGTQIKVYGISGNITSEDLILTVTVPIETVTINANASSVTSSSVSGGIVIFSAKLNHNKQIPTNSDIIYYVNSISNVDASVLVGNSLISNALKVKSGLASGLTVTVYAVAGGIRSNDIIINVVVPVETISITSNKTVVLSYSDLSKCEETVFTAKFNAGKKAPTNTETTYYIRSGLDFVEYLKGNTLKVKAGMPSGATITVYAISGGITSADIILTLNVPVETVYITPSTTQVLSSSQSGGEISFGASVNVGKQTPTNNIIAYYVEDKTNIVSDSIQSGTMLKDPLFKIKAGVAGGTIISVYAISENIKSASVEIMVIVPVEKISLVASATTIASYSTLSNCESVIYSAIINSGLKPATHINNIKYYAESVEYIDSSSISSATLLKTNSIKVKANVASGTGIKVYAICDGIKSSSVSVSVRVPVQSITLSSTYPRGTRITPTVNSGATNKTVVIQAYTVTNYGQTSNEYNNKDKSEYFDPAENSVFFAPTNLVAGSKVSIDYKASEDGGITRTCTFTIAALESSKFTLTYSSDSQGYALTNEQLETGKYTTITAKYNGAELYSGLTSSILTDSSLKNATATGMNLTASTSAAGNAKIAYTVKIQDGNTSYNISKTLSVFRRVKGEPSIQQSVIVQKTTTLTKLDNAIVANGTPTGYSLSKLEFIPSEGSNYGITAAGVLTIKTINVNPSIQLRMTQDYNGRTITYTSSPITIKFHTYTIQKVEEDITGPDSVIAINGLTGHIDPLVRPGFAFVGYYVNSTANLIWDSNGDRTSYAITGDTLLKAYWLKTHYQEDRDTDVYNISRNSYDDNYNPGFDVPALIKAGYTKVEITVNYDIRSESVWTSGQRLQIADYRKTKELGRKDTSQGMNWVRYVYTITVDISMLNSDTGAFVVLISKTETAEVSYGTRIITVIAKKR
jgi:hypothetical protein